MWELEINEGSKNNPWSVNRKNRHLGATAQPSGLVGPEECCGPRPRNLDSNHRKDFEHVWFADGSAGWLATRRTPFPGRKYSHDGLKRPSCVT